MKLLNLVVIGILLVGCGKGGSETAGSGAVTNPPGLDSTCKSIADIWTSTTDSEKHDFRNLQLTSTIWTAYTYTGYNGTLCNQSIKIYTGNSVVQAAGFHYTMEFQNNSPAVGCDFYQDGSGPSTTHGSAHAKIECNKITICKTILQAAGECQEFN